MIFGLRIGSCEIDSGIEGGLDQFGGKLLELSFRQHLAYDMS